jgi:predicted amidohydrolase
MRPLQANLRVRLCVVEAGGARLAILVCEDLARLHAFAAALHGHGVSLILVPVFARPTKDRRWERSRAEVYSDARLSLEHLAPLYKRGLRALQGPS